jgi:hypothetical protein
MKLLRIQLEHFGCVRRAAVELGAGLNVLYGPNDLGKSSLQIDRQIKLSIRPVEPPTLTLGKIVFGFHPFAS